MTTPPRDDEIERLWHLVKLSEDIKGATNKCIDDIAELAYMQLDVDFDEFDFESQLNELDEEIRNIVAEIKSKYGGDPYNKDKLESEIKSNRELNLHLSNILKAKNLIDEIKENYDLQTEDLELASKTAALSSAIIKTRARKDIIPLIHRGLYAEDIKSALNFWSNNSMSELGRQESTWQQEFADRRSILERVIGGRVKLLETQAHVGSSGLSGKGEKITDYLFHHSDTRNVTLVEIKTPHTKLIGKAYRGTFALSEELSGTVAQVLTQRVELTKHFFQKAYNSATQFEVNAPKCYIIAGNLSTELGEDAQKKKAFEMQRYAVSSAVTIITFDELYDQFAKFNVAA